MKDVIGNPNTKGIILLSRKAFVEATWGRESWEQVLLRLSAVDQEVLRGLIVSVGWHERAIEMCGGRKVKVQETQCRIDGAPHCEYHCQWEI